MLYGKRWTDFTYLFRTKKLNPDVDNRFTQPDPIKTERRRRIEELKEQRELGQSLAEVWE